jgi:hypothetical protein
VDYAKGYRWYKDSNKPLSGEESDELIMLDLTTADSGLYVVEAYNGCMSHYDTLLVVVKSNVEFTLQPKGDTVCEGNPVALVAQAKYADSTVWLYNGVRIDTSVDKGTLYIGSAMKAPHEGDYRFVAYNYCGNDTSKVAPVKVNLDPVFGTKMSRDANAGDDTLRICEGEALALSFTALHHDSVAWFYNNEHLEDIKGNTYSDDSIVYTLSGWYKVKVINGCSEAIDSLYVRVDTFPRIQLPEVLLEVVTLCEGNPEQELVLEASSVLYADSAKWFHRVSGYPDREVSGIARYAAGHEPWPSDAGDYYLVAYNRYGECKNDTAWVQVGVTGSLSDPDRKGSYYPGEEFTVCEGDSVKY